MRRRFIAHWFRGGSNHDGMRAEQLEDLVPFVASRTAETIASAGGISICVGDLQSKAQSPWIWRMSAGGEITLGTGKYAKRAAELFKEPGTKTRKGE